MRRRSASRARRTSCARCVGVSTATIRPARCSSGAVGRCMTGRRASTTGCRCRQCRSGTDRHDRRVSAPQSVEPFEEIDHEPGAYGGVEWRYASRVPRAARALRQPRGPRTRSATANGAGTRQFTQLGVQTSLPAQLGLVAQWMNGDTYWISRRARERHALAVRRARRGRVRLAVPDADTPVQWRLIASRCATTSSRWRAKRRCRDPTDSGHAWTVAYRYERTEQLSRRRRVAADRRRTATCGRSTRRYRKRPREQLGCR